MYKIGFIACIAIIISGCSHFKVTAAMCDQIRQEHGELPQECRNYSEAEAQKAFDKVKNDKVLSNGDAIKFQQEE